MEIQNPFLSPSQGSGATEDESGLIKGSTLTARLLDITSLGQARLKIGSRVIQAMLSQYVEPGKTAKFTVQATQPQLILAPLPEEEQPPVPTKAQPEASAPSTLKSAATGPLKRNATFAAKILDVKPEGNLRLQLIPDQPALKHIPGKGYMANPNAPVLEGRLEKNSPAADILPGRVVKFTTVEPAPRLVVRPESKGPAAQAAKAFGTPMGKGPSPAAPSPTRELTEATAQLREILFSGLDIPETMKPGLERLTELVGGLSPKQDGQDPQFATRLMRNMGFFKEDSPIQKEIADLFSHATGDKSDARTDTTALRALLEASAKFNEVLDRTHMASGETMARDNSMVLAFPVFWQGSSGRGEMRFQKPGPEENENSNRSWRVSILLDLSRIGRIKADVEVARTEVSGTVWAQSDSVRNVVQGSLNRLSEGLESKGFKIGDLSVRLFPADRPIPDTLSESPAPPEDGVVDLKV